MKPVRVTRWLTLAAVVLGMSVYLSPVYANSIGPDCETCQGSIYTLTYTGTPESTFVSGSKTYDVWDITLTINSSGYDGGGAQLRAVAIKVTDQNQGAGPASGVAGLDNASSGSWTFAAGGLSSGGCDGHGAGFECAYAKPGVPVPIGTLYSWTFDAVVPSGKLFTTPDAASIKAQYTDANGHKVGDLVSENITLGLSNPVPTLDAVPEPTTFLLWGTVATGLGLARWHRRRRGEGPERQHRR